MGKLENKLRDVKEERRDRRGKKHHWKKSENEKSQIKKCWVVFRRLGGLCAVMSVLKFVLRLESRAWSARYNELKCCNIYPTKMWRNINFHPRSMVIFIHLKDYNFVSRFFSFINCVDVVAPIWCSYIVVCILIDFLCQKKSEIAEKGGGQETKKKRKRILGISQNAVKSDPFCWLLPEYLCVIGHGWSLRINILSHGNFT